LTGFPKPDRLQTGDFMLGIYCRTSRDTDIENSTISQQRTAGIKFAKEHKFEYEIYEDEGKSGYKISDEDKDIFKNRPAFTKLIADIENNKIDKVWVLEHSRLSRNEVSSVVIFRLFKKFNIELYEINKKLNLDDPQSKLLRQLLDAIAEYERQLIVVRTSRGKQKRVDEGYRVYQRLFGYVNSGRDQKGHVIWEPVESEVETYKYISKRFLEGANLKKISNELYQSNNFDEKKLFNYAKFYGRILKGYQYTGYQLTIEGTEIFKKFRKNEIENPKILLNRKYWVKSVPFPLELITIEEWVKLVERLQINSKKFGHGPRILKADKDIATGLVECAICGMRYYSRELKCKTKKKGDVVYSTYYHSSVFAEKKCIQRPKSFNINHLDNIFKLFYFYFYLVFDNRADLIKDSQRNINQTQIKLKEKIVKTDKEIATIEKRIEKFQRLMDKQETDDLLEMILRNIKLSEEKLNELNIELSKLKIEYEIQIDKFNQTEYEMAYYDVKEKINDWFFTLDIEKQRNELIKAIRTCKIFNHHILIDTGKIVFIFDIDQHYIFDMKLLENLNKDEVYKEHFVELKGKREVRKLNDKLIHNVNLTRDKETRMRVFQYLVKEYQILYDITEKTTLISFVPLRGLMMLELEQFDNEE
jgi:DNA invertase Pin-like site-specific DNA recombinase